MVFSHSPVKRLPDCSLFFIYRVYLNNCMHSYCRWHTMYDTIKHDTIKHDTIKHDTIKHDVIKQ